MNENKKWYAVMTDAEDNDWGYGSSDYDEAVKMVQPFVADGGYIAVIDDGDDPVCVEEIHEF